jgi:hypothetical protein
VTVSVAVATNAAATLTNAASVAGGGDVDGSDNSSSLTVNIAPLLSTIETWRQTHFGSSLNLGSAADTNVVTLDGLPNLSKYAFGLNPNTQASAADQPQVSGSMPFSMTFRRAKQATDVTIRVQAASSPTNGWTNIWTSATNAYGGGTNAYEIITVTDPVSSENVPVGRFLRLDVTRP